MKNRSVVSLVFATGLCLSIVTAMAQDLDLAKLEPDAVKVLEDNDQVRILDIEHKPGEKEPMHAHSNYVAVFLTDARLKTTMPDGKTFVTERKAGEVMYGKPVTHAVQNVGTNDTHVIIVELKK